MAEHFIVQRSGALGDVILTTPVIRRLRREHPDALIQIMTGHPEVFAYSPHLGMPQAHLYVESACIDLNLAYETRPTMHIVQAYMQEAFGDPGEPAELQQELNYLFEFARGVLFEKTNFVAVHAAAAGWRNRTLPRETWHRVVAGIERLGYVPVLVGTERDRLADTSAFTAMLNRSLLDQTAFISQCMAFVGSDSALLHAAGATQTPIAAIMTCAKPETRLPFRHGELGWHCEAVVPDLDCVGCLADRPPPVTTEFCRRGDTLCVERVYAEQILDAIQKVVAL